MAAGPEGRAPSGFFVLRAPAYAIDELLAWSDGLAAAAAVADPAALAAAVAADEAVLRARLRAWVARPDVREALYLASPGLDDALAAWQARPAGDRKIEVTLTKYLARATGRPTPFGLFAGVALGQVGPHTALTLGSPAQRRRVIRLDHGYLANLTALWSARPEVRRALPLRTNSSLARAAGGLRYITKAMRGASCAFRLIAVDPSDYIDAALQIARGGATHQAVAAAVARTAEVDEADAAAFVDALLDDQLLVCDLDPPLTGAEPIDDLIEQLARVPGFAPTVALLEDVRAELRAMSDCPEPLAPERYRRLHARLAELPEVDTPHRLQVDLVQPVEQAVLGRAIAGEVLRAVDAVHRLCPAPEESDLDEWKRGFVERFGGQAVPLLEALDDEAGISFLGPSGPAAEISPLLAGLGFPGARRRPSAWRPHHDLLLGKLEDTWAAGRHELVIEPRELEALAAPSLPLPDSLSALVAFAARSPEALARGDVQLRLDVVSGPPGATLLGRFCHALPGLAPALRGALRTEEAHRPDADFAEIVHLHEVRLGNVLRRPLLRGREIVFLARSGAPAERQIPASDLRVAVEGNRIVLRCAGDGREIIPRLTCALNLSWGPTQPVFRFLGTLAMQGVARGIVFRWGPLDAARFLPRVVFGRTVLSRARWLLPRARIVAMRTGTRAEIFAAMAALRRELRLPRHVALQDDDLVLPFDLDNVFAVDALVQLAAARPSPRLQEIYPAFDDAPLRGPGGSHLHEMVIPFDRAPPVAPPPPPPLDPPRPPHAAPTVTRSFRPGSEWLYLKLFTTPSRVDPTLRDVVAPTIARLSQAGAVSRWFFLRFNQPSWHLRLRCLGAPARLRDEVAPALLAAAEPLCADGRLVRVELDSYDRELERYGGAAGIELAEQVFHVDSEAALALLHGLDGEQGADQRWRLALAGMDALLDDFGLDLPARRRLVDGLRTALAREHGVDDAFWHRAGKKFRDRRLTLEPLLERRPGGSPLDPGFAILRERSRRLAPIAAELRALDARGALDPPLLGILTSFLHMHANRLLRSAQRAQELVLYDYLGRLYTSRLARR